MNKLFDLKTLKFIIVGIINTLIGTSIMFILYNFIHLSYWMSSSANYIITSILSYFLNKRFTFHDNSHALHSIWKFVINIIICYLLAYGIAKPLTLWLLRGYSDSIITNIAMIVGMVFFTGFNYIGQRFFVFTNHS